MAEKRIIRVTGYGKVSVNPDMVRLIITFSKTLPEYAKAVEESAGRRKNLVEELTKIGFLSSDIKTLSFNVNTDYEHYNDENGNWIRRFNGYRYEHRMAVEFKRDNELLGKVLYAFAHCEGEPEYEISFTVSDVEKVRAELLEKAVDDAREKAEVLTKSAGVKLGEILTIDCSWNEIRLTTPAVGELDHCKRLEASDRSFDVDIEPEDIRTSETVNVVWEIR